MKCACGTSGMEWKVTFVIGTLEFFNFNFFCMLLCGRQTAGAELTSEFDSPLKIRGFMILRYDIQNKLNYRIVIYSV